MIRYALTCEDGHGFESWFQSAEAFDTLAERGLVGCAVCGSTRVKKSVMAPRIGAKANRAAAPAQERTQPMAAGPLSAPGSELERKIAELRAHVEKHSTYVGRDFAREARQQHLGEAPERQIHGEATVAEARDLIEDGVPVMPLPGVPKSRSN